MAKISKQTKKPQKNKQALTLLIIFIAAAGVFTAKYFIEQARAKIPVDTSKTNRTKGNPEAKIKIVEYMDFQCPACALGAGLLKGIFERAPNDLHVEMHYFPLTKIHSHAMLSAQYAECAAQQGQFWPLHDLLIERQAQWKDLSDAKPAFEEMAKEIKLNMPRLETCLQDERINTFIYNDQTQGQALGVQSTPTYFINGEMVVGAKSLAEKIMPYLQSAVPSTPAPAAQ